MKWQNIELIVICIFISLTIIEAIQVGLSIRIAGQNLLNARLWSYIAVFVIWLGDRSVFTNKSFTWLYLYVALFLLLELVGHYDLQSDRSNRFNWLYWQHYSIAVCIILRNHFIQNGRDSGLQAVINIVFLSYLIACVLNIYVIYRYPAAVRGNESTWYLEDVGNFTGMGLSGYGVVSSLPFVLPLLVYKAKKAIVSSKSYTFVLWAATIGLVLLSSYMSVIVAPFLLSIVFFVLAVLGRRRFKTNLLLMVAFFTIYIIIPKTTIANSVGYIANIVPNTEISNKLEDVSSAMSGGFEIVEQDKAKGSIEGRASRIGLNLEFFFKNPVIGTGRSSAGEHIYWLHLLAQFGLIGAWPMYRFVYKTYFKESQPMPENFKFYYFLSYFCFICLGFLKAMGGISMFIIPLFLAPGMAYIESQELKR